MFHKKYNVFEGSGYNSAGEDASGEGVGGRVDFWSSMVGARVRCTIFRWRRWNGLGLPSAAVHDSSNNPAWINVATTVRGP